MNKISEVDFDNEHQLDKFLKEDPGYFLSEDFADHLAKKIEVKQSVKQNTIEYLTILGVVVAIIITFGGTYYFLNKENFLLLKPILVNNYTPTITLIVLFILFMDKILLRLLNQLK